jgi:archaellum component FlaG (FlaF/FlaG flagellin family)
LGSSTISESILVLVSIILASGFSAYATYMAGLVRSDLAQALTDARRMSSLKVEIVYASVDKAEECFVIYVKNTGNLPITDFSLVDVYVGPYGSAEIYVYNRSASRNSGYFNLTDVDGDCVWEPAETAVIRAYPKGGIPQASMYEALVKPFKGIGSSYLFPPPP